MLRIAAAAIRALELDSTLGEAHNSLAFVLTASTGINGQKRDATVPAGWHKTTVLPFVTGTIQKPLPAVARA
ncbi:MAG TPA: hypothetical protein VIH78_09450 [Terriglobales bacterium]